LDNNDTAISVFVTFFWVVIAIVCWVNQVNDSLCQPNRWTLLACVFWPFVVVVALVFCLFYGIFSFAGSFCGVLVATWKVIRYGNIQGKA
jgi:TctA family transporter